MEEFKPNSHKAQNESLAPKKVEKVTKSPAKLKSKGLAGLLFSEDVKDVKSYILTEVLIPTLKKAIDDTVTNGIRYLLFGESRGSNKPNTSSGISYKDYYRQEKDERKPRSSAWTTSQYSDVIITDRGEAEEVLRRMDEIVEQYGMVSVADLYDLVGISGDYTAFRYGWTDIRSANIVRVKDGHMIKMPRVKPLN